MAQSPALKNLLRRVRRFNQSNPTNQLNVESYSSIGNNNVKIQRANDRITRLQKVSRLNKKIQKTANNITELKTKGFTFEATTTGKVKPTKIKLPKTVTAAEKEYRRVKQLEKKAADFRKRQDKFIRKAAKYNRHLSRMQNSKRFVFLPRTEAELVKAEKALALIKKNNVAEAKKTLNIPKTKEFRKGLMDADSKSLRKNGGYSYHDRVFFFQAVKNARNSLVPELADLFLEGGESLLLDLENAGFSMVEWYDVDETLDEPEQHIYAMLEDALETMNGRNRVITERFIERTAGKYK